MARKSSVIMSAAERKEAANDIKADIKSQKEALKLANEDIKAAEKELKARVKERDSIAKALAGLNTRKDALKAPKPLVTR